MFEEYNTNDWSTVQQCQDCGYVSSHKLSKQYWDDQDRDQVDAGKDYWDVEQFHYPGTVHYQLRGGVGLSGSLGWDDPHGDRFRRDIHQHNSKLQPTDPTYIVEAYVTIYNPSAQRWERAYIETGVQERHRYRTTVDQWNRRPLPTGAALKPESDHADAHSPIDPNPSSDPPEEVELPL